MDRNLVLGVALLAVGVAIATYSTLVDPDALPARWWRAREAALAGDLAFVRAKVSARTVLIAQAIGVVGALSLAMVSGQPLFVLVVPFLVIGPALHLQKARAARVTAVESDVEAWLTAMASSLRTDGSIGGALAYASRLSTGAMSEELEVLLVECELGATLDDALRRLSERIRSPMITGVVALLLVGRRTGGELPALLESNARQLREIARLEGVIRSKTAEGKGQIWVLGALPLAIALALRALSPGYFDPLFEGLIGGIVLALAIALWLAAIFTARSVLALEV
ncbi:type II secretion system F family protein [Sandaracinus amylolyticus]|uniref:Flp pilus assembly protein TadB n=1 Tax=Sandaracinus amylolyticus TaxID=927083 RepID=A0A0F6YGI2_9BACT|nr:type II secretion system F family protein [Sandaracinus amylolyticus]AKF03713.1 Flp pilus assembly protein TadB [Sandaracinus amylolyticus]